MEKSYLVFKYKKQFDRSVLNLIKDDPKYLFYNIYASYNTNKLVLCMDYIEKFEKVNTNKTDQYLVEYFKYKISNKSSRKIIAALENNYNRLEKMKDRNYTRLVLNLLLKEYEEIGDYEKLYHYALKLTELHP